MQDSSKLDLLELDTEQRVFVALEEAQPVGLIVFGWDRVLAYCHLISLFVVPEKRGQGIGKQLLSLFKAWSCEHKVCLLTLHYALNSATEVSFAMHLLENGWQGLRPYKIICHFDKTFDPLWLSRLPVLPQGVEEFPWKKLSTSEKETIEAALSSGRVPSIVSPFERDNFEPINSLGLRANGTVIGWLITHRVGPDAIRYTAFYLDPAYQSLGLAARLLGDAILLNLNSAVNQAVCEINLLHASSQWTRFLYKRLIPQAYLTHYLFQIWRPLGPSLPEILR